MDLPEHLREDASPTAVCDACGRKSWATIAVPGPCLMPQPNGERCAGVLVLPDPPSTGRDDRLDKSGPYHRQRAKREQADRVPDESVEPDWPKVIYVWEDGEVSGYPDGRAIHPDGMMMRTAFEVVPAAASSPAPPALTAEEMMALSYGNSPFDPDTEAHRAYMAASRRAYALAESRPAEEEEGSAFYGDDHEGERE